MTRRVWLVLVVFVVALAGCSGRDGHRSSSDSFLGRSTAPTTAVSFPDAPPPSSDCPGRVADHRDVGHPTLGTVRLFVLLNTRSDAWRDDCVVAVGRNGQLVTAITVSVSGDALAFANPVTDATGNAFVTYNPGRYDGVLVLVPTADGFEDVGWGDTHYVGKRAYYYAKLDGPGSDGKYAIRQSRKDCTPDCAGGTITEKVLRWDGHDYV